jgi:hypothetical protein
VPEENKIRDQLWTCCLVSVFSSTAATLLLSFGDDLGRPLKYGMFFGLLSVSIFTCCAMIAMLKEHPFLLKDQSKK